jgi:hypothetical protein
MTPSPAVLSRSLSADDFKDNILFQAESETAYLYYNGDSPTFEAPIGMNIYMDDVIVASLTFDASRLNPPTPFAFADPFDGTYYYQNFQSGNVYFYS